MSVGQALERAHVLDDCPFCMMPMVVPTAAAARGAGAATEKEKEAKPLVVLTCAHVFHACCMESYERFVAGAPAPPTASGAAGGAGAASGGGGLPTCPLCRAPYQKKPFDHTHVHAHRQSQAAIAREEDVRDSAAAAAAHAGFSEVSEASGLRAVDTVVATRTLALMPAAGASSGTPTTALMVRHRHAETGPEEADDDDHNDALSVGAGAARAAVS